MGHHEAVTMAPDAAVGPGLWVFLAARHPLHSHQRQVIYGHYVVGAIIHVDGS